MNACMHTNVRTHTYTHVHTRTRTRTHAHTHTHTHTHTHIHTYIHTYIHICVTYASVAIPLSGKCGLSVEEANEKRKRQRVQKKQFVDVEMEGV